jgi:hypothetical protein
MITEELIRDILEQYTKHGWILSRVLLLPETASQLSISLESLFGIIPVDVSDIDAAWFYRSSIKDRTAWEIRHLSSNPFALCETFDDDIDNAELFEAFRALETRLREKTSKAEK